MKFQTGDRVITQAYEAYGRKPENIYTMSGGFVGQDGTEWYNLTMFNGDRLLLSGDMLFPAPEVERENA